MVGPRAAPALRQFVDDEMLRAPMLFDQLADATTEQIRKTLPSGTHLERQTGGELMLALRSHRARLAERFVQSLQEQVHGELGQAAPPAALPRAPKAVTLALVEEDAVALDVELSHTIQHVKNTAEHELRELSLYLAALAGDMDVAEDHNPFRPDTWARALWAAAQALPLSRGHQVALLRLASDPLAQLLRQAFAGSISRLEQMGVEPAAYRTVVLPGGSRRAWGAATTFSPDLHRIRETMPAPRDPAPGGLSYQGQLTPSGSAMQGLMRERWADVAHGIGNRADRQSIELVSRLFEAMLGDTRVPQDVIVLISRLHGPAMRLALRDEKVLDKDSHPLWRFINLLAYEAEMAPDPQDPERVRLLRLGQQQIDQIAADPDQRAGLYRRAVERLEEFLRQRLARRCTAAATQIGAMQKLEDSLVSGEGTPSTLGGMLDVPVMDTVPSAMIGEGPRSQPGVKTAAESWLESLRPGVWVRMFLHGRWVHAQLMWPGERGEVWLFGDGASDQTWAVRRNALLMMHAGALAKTLKVRSLVGSAAARVQQQIGTPQGAA